jgi:hypothetical protein
MVIQSKKPIAAIFFLISLAAIDICIYFYFKEKLIIFGLSSVEFTMNPDSLYSAPPSRFEQHATAAWGTQPQYVHDVLINETRDVIVDSGSQIEVARRLRHWVHSQAQRFGTDVEVVTKNSMNPLGILSDIRDGYSVQCVPLAILLIESLRANGIAARQIGMSETAPLRQGFSHALVEAYVDGGWVVMDPTFDREWHVDGVASSAYAARDAYLMGKGLTIKGNSEPDFRLSHLYPSYSRAFQNIHIIHELSSLHRALARWPILKVLYPQIRVLLGPSEKKHGSPFFIISWITWLAYFIIPLIGLVLTLFISISIGRQKLLNPNGSKLPARKPQI